MGKLDGQAVIAFKGQDIDTFLQGSIAYMHQLRPPDELTAIIPSSVGGPSA